MLISLNRPSITAEAAQRLIRAAEQHAAQSDVCISTCVVDTSGVLKAFSRMDGAPLVSVSVARKKAVTAVGFGIPTGTPWHEFVKDDPILSEGVRSIDDFTMLGGGFPIEHGGAVIGAVGVSGGHYTQDEACAQAALATLPD